ncbi:MAG: PAS domain S-box protein [Chloroflexi bacterium]|nr:PAS domain S-box protein [Chloroflexota bacterium]
MENSSEAIISFDGNLLIRSWNKAAEALYGWRADEVIGQPVSAVLPVEIEGLDKQADMQAGLEKGSWRGEVIYRRKDGLPVNVSVASVGLKDTQGKTTGVLSIHTDITQRKIFEARLAVQERLADLGKMAGTIAHEVRNPLATVDASAYYLEQTLKDAGDKTKDHLRRMRAGVTRASTIIEKLLEMSHMKEPRLRLVNLTRFVSEIVSAAGVPPNTKVVLHGETVKVRADEEQLGLALENLIRNAVEAMPEGGTLTVDVREADDQAEISVSDTGEGIQPEMLPRLFEPLFTTKPGGVGYGLALA